MKKLTKRGLFAGALISATALTMSATIASAEPPKLSEADFDKAKNLYFQRCAGCHGVLRKGATGKNLEPKNTMKLGTEKLAKIIKLGTDAGMNPFNDIFDDATIELLKTMLEMAVLKLDDEEVRSFLKTDMKTKVSMPAQQ